MLDTKVYIQRILYTHAALLLLVLLVVGGAAIQIYDSAWNEAVEGASGRQELLAAQTARGIKQYYDDIADNLGLLSRNTAPGTLPEASRPSGESRPAGASRPSVTTIAVSHDIANYIWDQLNNRITALFSYTTDPKVSESDRIHVFSSIPTDDDPTQMTNLNRELESLVGVLGPTWMAEVDQSVVSRALTLNYAIPGKEPRLVSVLRESSGGSVNLVCVPAEQTDDSSPASRPSGRRGNPASRGSPPRGGRRVPSSQALSTTRRGTRGRGGRGSGQNPAPTTKPVILIAVVPTSEIQSRFLPVTEERQATSATLADENLSVMESTTASLLGLNLRDIDDQAIRDMLEYDSTQPAIVTQAINHPITIAGEAVSARLVTREWVDILGSTWCLLETSPMSQVNDVVHGIFLNVVYWAAFLVIAMTAILVSTAYNMVQVRIRLERFQHAVLNKEISQARQIQLNWLPDKDAAGPALDIAAVNRPASHISGDFYNWFPLEDGRQVITIGDVTGHGMAAAFLMATTQLLVRTVIPRTPDPGACMTEVNRQLCTQAFYGQFVTMLIVLLDLEHGTLEVATAGHSPPLVDDGNGNYRSLKMESQLVLAVEPTQVYVTEKFHVAPESAVVLYTDGVVDLQAEDGTRFSTNDLIEALRGPTAVSQTIINRTLERIDQFRGKRDIDDDLTLVAMRMKRALKSA